MSALHRTGGRHVAFAPFDAADGRKSDEAARRGRTRPPPATITARQLAVAALVVRGLSNPEVARVLNISINTVKKHVRDLFERCEVASRAELAARLVASGLVDLVDL